jgi:hypothetical protein
MQVKVAVATGVVVRLHGEAQACCRADPRLMAASADHVTATAAMLAGQSTASARQAAISSGATNAESILQHHALSAAASIGEPFLATNDLCLFRVDGVRPAAQSNGSAAFATLAFAGTTTSGTGGRVGPTSNDAGDPNPIAGLLANADRAAAPDEAAGPRSQLLTAPCPG